VKPLAYFITWTTYGTWLHGDARGWVQSGEPGIQPPDNARIESARQRMTDEAVLLDVAQRQIIEQVIREHCRIRGWMLHAASVRGNHVHVVVTADVAPEDAMKQFKAWGSRRLSDYSRLPARSASEGRDGRKRWWTEHGSTKWINDETYLQNAIRYVNERQ
jgi:REP element-mobilizing transposase RayT